MIYAYLYHPGTHRYVAFLSGLAHITLPNSNQEAWIRGGKYGLIIAADTADVSRDGHITQYPSMMETTALQIPLARGVVPPHKLLHAGPCQKDQMVST